MRFPSSISKPKVSGISEFWEVDVGKLQDDHEPYDKAIVGQLIAILPQEWESVVLTIEKFEDPGDITRFSHEIFNPDGLNGVVIPNEEIFVLSRRLSQVFADHGCDWVKVEYRVDEEADGNWKYVVNFSY